MPSDCHRNVFCTCLPTIWRFAPRKLHLVLQDFNMIGKYLMCKWEGASEMSNLRNTCAHKIYKYESCIWTCVFGVNAVNNTCCVCVVLGINYMSRRVGGSMCCVRCAFLCVSILAVVVFSSHLADCGLLHHELHWLYILIWTPRRRSCPHNMSIEREGDR